MDFLFYICIKINNMSIKYRESNFRIVQANDISKLILEYTGRRLNIDAERAEYGMVFETDVNEIKTEVALERYYDTYLHYANEYIKDGTVYHYTLFSIFVYLIKEGVLESANYIIE